MRIFAVKDETDSSGKTLAWLIYYETAKRFYVELPDDADPWETPLLLSSVLKRGEHTVNAYWSRLWVQQRIVPPDRQNLGQILRDNGMETYDEFTLLALAQGRCAQDHYYLVPVTENELPESVTARFLKKVEDVVPLAEHKLLVFFRDGLVRKCSVPSLTAFQPILKHDELFRTVTVQAGGYGVCWGEQLELSDSMLYENGQIVPLSLDDFCSFVSNRIVNTAEAAVLLNCSRQNIDDLVRRGRLHPVKTTPRNKLFLKSELSQRQWY